MTRKIEVETLKMSPDSEKYFQYQEDVETLEYMYRTLDKLESRYRAFPSANKDVTLSEYLKKEEDLRRTIQKRVDANRENLKEIINKYGRHEEIGSKIGKVAALNSLLGRRRTQDKEQALQEAGFYLPDLPPFAALQIYFDSRECPLIHGIASEVASWAVFQRKEVHSPESKIQYFPKWDLEDGARHTSIFGSADIIINHYHFSWAISALGFDLPVAPCDSVVNWWVNFNMTLGGITMQAVHAYIDAKPIMLYSVDGSVPDLAEFYLNAEYSPYIFYKTKGESTVSNIPYGSWTLDWTLDFKGIPFTVKAGKRARIYFGIRERIGAGGGVVSGNSAAWLHYPLGTVVQPSVRGIEYIMYPAEWDAS